MNKIKVIISDVDGVFVGTKKGENFSDPSDKILIFLNTSN